MTILPFLQLSALKTKRAWLPCDNYRILWLFCPGPKMVTISVFYILYHSRGNKSHIRLTWSGDKILNRTSDLRENIFYYESDTLIPSSGDKLTFIRLRETPCTWKLKFYALFSHLFLKPGSYSAVCVKRSENPAALTFSSIHPIALRERKKSRHVKRGVGKGGYNCKMISHVKR